MLCVQPRRGCQCGVVPPRGVGVGGAAATCSLLFKTSATGSGVCILQGRASGERHTGAKMAEGKQGGKGSSQHLSGRITWLSQGWFL